MKYLLAIVLLSVSSFSFARYDDYATAYLSTTNEGGFGFGFDVNFESFMVGGYVSTTEVNSFNVEAVETKHAVLNRGLYVGKPFYISNHILTPVIGMNYSSLTSHYEENGSVTRQGNSGFGLDIGIMADIQKRYRLGVMYSQYDLNTSYKDIQYSANKVINFSLGYTF
ncbi:hypothetical protein [Vibrio phage vB_VhaP_PG11]|nr:hypothetical protein [Vibrio phage vB_VhaP_PG11]